MVNITLFYLYYVMSDLYKQRQLNNTQMYIGMYAIICYGL